MYKSILALGALAMTTGLGAAHAGDISAGESSYNTCISCHQADGSGSGIFPPLKGLSAETVVDKLERYRDGETIGQHTNVMAPQARNLSDEDIANLAAFIEAEFN